MALSPSDQRRLVRKLEGRSRAEKEAIIGATYEAMNKGIKDPIIAGITRAKEKIAIAAGSSPDNVNYNGIQYGNGGWNVPVNVPGRRIYASQLPAVFGNLPQFKNGYFDTPASTRTAFVPKRTEADAWVHGLRQYEEGLKNIEGQLVQGKDDQWKSAQKEIRLADLRKNSQELLFNQKPRGFQPQQKGMFSQLNGGNNPINQISQGFDKKFDMASKLR